MSPLGLSSNHHLELPDDVFRRLREIIYDKSGLWFSDSNKYLLQKRLSTRARDLNFDDFQKYYYFLAYDPNSSKELDKVFDLVTTNETYFFRELQQLKAFSEEILPELLERNRGEPVRIWSAGCSSGEEPYTIAMLLDMKGLGPDRAEIFASDINQEVLARAREGIYRPNSFRATETDIRDAYFTEVEPERWRIDEKIRNRVSFGRLNLYDTARVSLLGKLDLIFCRNVIIYFDDNSKKKVVRSFYNQLVDGGYLLLGHSESLIALSTEFRLRHLENDMVYQK